MRQCRVVLNDARACAIGQRTFKVTRPAGGVFASPVAVDTSPIEHRFNPTSES